MSSPEITSIQNDGMETEHLPLVPAKTDLRKLLGKLYGMSQNQTENFVADAKSEINSYLDKYKVVDIIPAEKITDEVIIDILETLDKQKDLSNSDKIPYQILNSKDKLPASIQKLVRSLMTILHDQQEEKLYTLKDEEAGEQQKNYELEEAKKKQIPLQYYKTYREIKSISPQTIHNERNYNENGMINDIGLKLLQLRSSLGYQRVMKLSRSLLKRVTPKDNASTIETNRSLLFDTLDEITDISEIIVLIEKIGVEQVVVLINRTSAREVAFLINETSVEEVAVLINKTSAREVAFLINETSAREIAVFLIDETSVEKIAFLINKTSAREIAVLIDKTSAREIAFLIYETSVEKVAFLINKTSAKKVAKDLKKYFAGGPLQRLYRRRLGIPKH